jgi:hypothetical protein
VSLVPGPLDHDFGEGPAGDHLGGWLLLELAAFGFVGPDVAGALTPVWPLRSSLICAVGHQDEGSLSVQSGPCQALRVRNPSQLVLHGAQPVCTAIGTELSEPLAAVLDPLARAVVADLVGWEAYACA